MKKSIALLAIVVAVFFTLTGCGESEKKYNKVSKGAESPKSTKKDKNDRKLMHKWNISNDDPIIEAAKNVNRDNFQEVIKTHWGISLDILPVKKVGINRNYDEGPMKQIEISFGVPHDYDYVSFLSKIFDQVKPNIYWEPEQKFKKDSKFNDYIGIAVKSDLDRFAKEMPKEKLDEFFKIEGKEKFFSIGPIVYSLKENDLNTL